MKQVFSHPWNVSPREAIKLQEELKEKIILKKGFSEIKRIAGADISFSKKSNRAYSAVIIFSFPELEILEEQHTIGNLSFPYIPGLLTFREGPLLIEAFKKIKIKPDVIIFDGHGIAHPKRLGLATHMGILLDKPTIGCAKSKLIGTYREPERKKGSYSLLKDDGEIIGAALRTRENVSPVFISPGHRIDLKGSIEIVLECLRGYRLPEPTRQAHLLVNKMRGENRE
ncbi:deoxyribonuclease V [bacterium]|nr:deoxyribonuclease V [bacterium]